MIPLALLPSYLDEFRNSASKQSGKPVLSAGNIEAYRATCDSWEAMCEQCAEEKHGMVESPDGKIVIQPVSGFMCPYADAEEEAFFGMFDTNRVRETVQYAAKNPNVKCLVLAIQSPGGSSMMNRENAQALVDLKEQRPDIGTVAYIEGVGASAAYYLASGCDEIHAASGSIVGSISSIGIYDESYDLFSRMGVTRHVFTGGKHKSMGHAGVKFTEEQLAEAERITMSFDSEFRGFVGARRGLNNDAMQGQVFIARKGEYPDELIDNADWGSLADFMQALQSEINL